MHLLGIASPVTALALLGGVAPLPALPQQGAPAAAAEAPVVAHLEWEPGSIGGRRSTTIEFAAAPPAGLELPAGVRDPRYAAIPLGDLKELAVVVDVDPERERIWIDHDFDGDFKDNPYAQWEQRGGTLMRTETVLVPYASEAAPVPVEILLYLQRRQEGPALTLTVDVHKTGEVVLGDRLRRIALRDETNRLRYDDGRGVVLFLDENGDDRFETPHGSAEHLHLGDSFRLGDEGWTFRLTDAAGTAVEFLRVAEAPPPVIRAWQPLAKPPAAVRLAPPPESAAELASRFAAEKGGAYAQRAVTVRALGATGDSAAFELLAEVARKDDELNIRIAAVSAMGNAAFAAHVEDLAKLLKEDEPRVAAAAVASLYRLGDPGFEERMLPLLGARDDEVAAAAAQHLAYLDSATAQQRVAELARGHDADLVRYRAYSGLRSQQAGPPATLMLAAAADDYAPLQALALGDLYALAHPDARAAALAAVDRPTAVPALVDAASLILIGAGDAEALEAVVALGAQAQPASRTTLVTRLSRMRSDEAVDVLLDGLKARAEARRGFCAAVLAGISTPEVADALAAQLKREKDDDTATLIIEALGEQQGAEATEALLRTAKKKGPLRGTSVRALARMGMADPDARKFLLGLLGSNTWQDTVYAVDAAAASGEVELGKKILPELHHKRWEVRLAVVQALRKLRARDWVEPLIARLAEEERPRVCSEIADTLFELTGVRIHTDASVWRRWWQEHGADFTMPATVPELPKARPGDTVGGFYGLPVTSDRLIFVIDQSGSMSARDTTLQEGTASERRTRLEQAVAQTVQAVSAMDDEDRVNVILFESSFHKWKDGIQELTRRNRADLEDFLTRQQPMGGTNLYDALELALEDPEVDTVILLSDGQPGAGRYVAPDDILRAVARLNQARRITIHCVSLGRDSQLLEQLAAEHGGRYVRR